MHEKRGVVHPETTPDVERQADSAVKQAGKLSTGERIKQLDDDLTKRAAEAAEKRLHDSP